MHELELSLAIHDYDHTRDLVEGRVATPGIRLRPIVLSPPEINARFTLHREWQVSEFGLGKYVALRAAGDDGITAIPVFPARAFRQSAVYVAAGSPLARLEELAGLRVGIPEWAQTAVIYARGALVDHHGIDLASIDWQQAGVSRPGRTEKVGVRLPDGVTVTPRPDATLESLLIAGEVDAIITAQPPDGFVRRDGSIRRLLADPAAEEEAYFRATGIFPIMHAVAIRRDVIDAHPWVAINLWKAFEEAKRRSLARLRDVMGWRVPLPWVTDHAERATDLFGDDPYPYGIGPNRVTLEAFLRWAHDQGVTERRVAVEELFAPTTHADLRL
jgi:4,5-dihydroxyphthalate decarboxylase